MEKINNLINSMTEPFLLIGDFIVRIGLGVSFFLSLNKIKIDFLSDILSFGALGQTRTVTPLRARILSPLCLPFHHEGFPAYIYINNQFWQK